MFELVDQGIVNYGMAPIENSTAGIIAKNHDMLYEYDLKICGEVNFRVEHALLTLEG